MVSMRHGQTDRQTPSLRQRTTQAKMVEYPTNQELKQKIRGNYAKLKRSVALFDFLR
jgi:hypothetical protein